MGSTGKQEESAGREDLQAKGTATTPPYKSKGGRLGEAPAEVGGRGGGGGVQLAVRGGQPTDQTENTIETAKSVTTGS